VTAEGIEEVLFHVSREDKFSLLLGLLEREKGKRILMFANMKRVAELLAGRLVRAGYHAQAITGDIDQRKRLKTMQAFKDGGLHILVATDVASRGLHIEGVSHVINYDLPQDAEDYVHRIGRTARAGASGKAISLADEAYVLSLEAIESLIGHKIPVEWPDESLFVSPEARAAQVEAARAKTRRAPGGAAAAPGGAAPAKPRRRRRRRRSTPAAEALPPAGDQ
jgi:ATP-dependent RNA helicase RhlB